VLVDPAISEQADGRSLVLPAAIEDYALIGDCVSAALVSRTGSIDWLCWPRFDDEACFAALMGTQEHGRWLLAPAHQTPVITRSYRADTMVLETLFSTPDGDFALIDFMPVGTDRPSIVRVIEGRRGRVAVDMALTLRFDYGATVPWVTRLDDDSGLSAISGPNMVVLRTPVETQGRDLSTVASFTVTEGETIPFVLSHGPSHVPPPLPFDPILALHQTETFWRDWSSRCTYRGPYRDAVASSLRTLKALTYAATGGIVAAPTTSLPEQPGGVRNWDYRYCWLRDATLTLQSFMYAGYFEEAQSWSDWLHRSVAGSADQVQIVYGLAGERYLTEWEVPWLPGYQGAMPVRIGNAAANQVQLDVYGEVMDALHHARTGGLDLPPSGWSLQCQMIAHLETIWNEPDEGIWETRGGPQQFTFSKIMAWVAFDRVIRTAEHFGLEAPLERWRGVRSLIHETVCALGYDPDLNSFVQSFGSKELDATLLLVSCMGFLPAEDPRVRGTVAAIERELLSDGFVKRYHTDDGKDGLPPGEGAFLACSFWLADAYAEQGRTVEAQAMFERLLALRNDVGLLAEEYDPWARRQLGNFPQAFSHTALIGTALMLGVG
jgi:GH15 family glucan-1,4-alpha-glucosidase